MLRRVLFSVGLFVLLSGCFYAKQEALDALPAQPHCPFQQRVTYEGIETKVDADGNPTQAAMGRFRFTEDPDNGRCVVTDAAGLTPSGSTSLGRILQSTTKHIDDGIYASYDRGEVNMETEYNTVDFITIYEDGTIEVRASCSAANGAAKLVIPGIPLDSDSNSCHLDTVGTITTAARNFRMMKLDQTFRPAPL